MDSEEVASFLDEAHIARVATVDDEGWPYVVPCWQEWSEGRFWVVARKKSAWAGYLQAEPRCAITVDEDGTQRKVIAQCRAEIVEEPNVGGRWVDVARRMSVRYLGQNGPEYLDPTLDSARWLIALDPVQRVDVAGQRLGAPLPGDVGRRMTTVEGSGPATDRDVVALTARLVAASSQNPGEDERRVADVVDELCAELGLPTPRRLGRAGPPQPRAGAPLRPGRVPASGCAATSTRSRSAAATWETEPLEATVVGERAARPRRGGHEGRGRGHAARRRRRGRRPARLPGALDARALRRRGERRHLRREVAGRARAARRRRPRHRRARRSRRRTGTACTSPAAASATSTSRSRRRRPTRGSPTRSGSSPRRRRRPASSSPCATTSGRRTRTTRPAVPP